MQDSWTCKSSYDIYDKNFANVTANKQYRM